MPKILISIKEIVIFTFVLLAFTAASAQCIPMNEPGPPRHWDPTRGCYVPQGMLASQQNNHNHNHNQTQWVGGGLGGQQVQQQGMVLNQPFVPVFGQQGIFTSAGNTYHCPALASWGGGLLGAILGNEIGKKVKVGDGRWSAVGAVAGAFAGHQIACELVGPITLIQQGQVATSVSNVGSQLCVIGGETFLPKRDETCEQMTLRVIKAAGGSNASVPPVSVLPQGSSPNWCVRRGQKYDCGEKMTVIRANGEIACRPANAAGEAGESLCTGVN